MRMDTLLHKDFQDIPDTTKSLIVPITLNPDRHPKLAVWPRICAGQRVVNCVMSLPSACWSKYECLALRQTRS